MVYATDEEFNAARDKLAKLRAMVEASAEQADFPHIQDSPKFYRALEKMQS